MSCGELQYWARLASLLLFPVIMVHVDAFEHQIKYTQLSDDPRNIYDCIDNQINYFSVRIHRHNNDKPRLFYESNHLAETKLAIRIKRGLRVKLVPINSRVAASTVIRDDLTYKSYIFKEIYIKESEDEWLHISFIFHTEPVDKSRILVLKFVLKVSVDISKMKRLR